MSNVINGIKVNGVKYSVNATGIETHIVSDGGKDFILKVDEKGGVYGNKEGVNTSFNALPSGGSEGQFLKKTATGAEWSDLSTNPSDGPVVSAQGLEMSDVNDDSASSRKFSVGVADGELKVLESKGELHQPYATNITSNSTSPATLALCINEIYANDKEEYLSNPEHNISLPVSHNFVEIANLNPYKTFDLSNVSLQYYNPAEKDNANKGWHILQLKGYIKPGSTFLIRGAKVANSNAPSTVINVDTFDMEWYENGKLMAFNNAAGSLYLSHESVIVPETDFYKTNGGGAVDKTKLDMTSNIKYMNPAAFLNAVTVNVSGTDYKVGPLLPKTYLDLFGWGANTVNTVYEKASFTGVGENCIIVRRNMLDRASQALQATLDKRTNAVGKAFEPIDLSKNALGNEKSFTPCSVNENKNVYTTRSDIREQRPYCVTVTFGIDATKTRCFNWISPGIEDEFIFYRKKGETEWNIKQSYKKGDGQDPEIRQKTMNFENVVEGAQNTYQMDLPFYDRVYWETSGGRFVSSHKVILRNLESEITYYTDNTLMVQSETPTEFTKGKVYEYCVGPANYDRYKRPISPREENCSPVYQFQVRSKLTTGAKWNFIQHSDEQGFNDCEYQVWRRVANIIRAQFNPQFTIDTGDMTQNGNRLSEWLDYNSGAESLTTGLKQTFTLNGNKTITNESAGVEQMNVVGNNDLAPLFDYVLGNGGDAATTSDSEGKVTTRQFKYFYCYEIDPDNMPATIGNKDVLSSVAGHTSEFEKEVKTWIPSCYSFNYNNCHFTAICSEITASSAVNEFGETPASADADNKKITTFDKTYDLIEDWCQKDLNKWYALSLDPESTATYPWCICYMHEMPWTILTSDVFSGEGKERIGGCKLNDFGSKEFHMSEILQNNRVRLCLGGHKHTHSESWNIAENVTYTEFFENNDVKNKYFSWELTKESGNMELLDTLQRDVDKKKTIVVLPHDTPDDILLKYKNTLSTATTDVKIGNISFPTRFPKKAEFYYVNEDKENWLPIYVMSQASGNKVVSNKEKPADSIPFLHYYYPEGASAVSPDQCYPHFVEYEFVQNPDGSPKDLNIRHYRVAMDGFCNGQNYQKIYYLSEENKDAFATGAPLRFNDSTDQMLSKNVSSTDIPLAPVSTTLHWINREDSRTLDIIPISEWGL